MKQITRIFLEGESPTLTINWNYTKPCTVQKQPPEVFYRKMCSEKFRKIQSKTTVPESLFF